jgi:predicted RNase H-like nuclease (RuvC/YqgF family)
MDLDLKILWAKNVIWCVRERIKNVREKLEKDKPDAKDYIEGSKESEEQLLKTELVIIEMENEIKGLNRELNQLARRNAELRVAYQELKNELKFKNIDAEL